MALPTKSNNKDPAIATKNDVTLNPVTLIPKIRFARNPPTKAPTIPKRIDPKIPPLLGAGSIAFATIPTITPKINQDNTFIKLFHLPPPSEALCEGGFRTSS